MDLNRDTQSISLSLSEREHRARDLSRPETPLGAHFMVLAAEARVAWPRVQIELAQFANHVARGLDAAEHDLPITLGALCIDDLYLACGCVLGARAALSAFDEHYIRNLRTFVRDIDSCPAKLDEIKQLLRERLLVGTAATAPRIGMYSGRGTLTAWVQVAAQRLALSALRRHSPEAPTPDALFADLMTPDRDPELIQLRLRHAHEFREALRSALAGLKASERVLLRLHLVEGVSLSRVAISYRVSQSTASRWYAQIRERVHDETKRQLRQLIGVDSAEFDSLARLLQSQLDLSLSRLLRSRSD